MSTNRPQRVTNRIQIGGYLGKDEHTFQIKSYTDDQLSLIAIDEGTGAEVRISLLAVFRGEYTYAATRDALRSQEAIKEKPPIIGLPKYAIDRATKIVRLIHGFESRLALLGHVTSTKPLETYCMENNICVATYFNNRKLYRKGYGSINRIAAIIVEQNGRGGIKHITAAAQHFLDILLLDYPTLEPGELLELAHNLMIHTGFRWVDPSLCDPVPDSLVKELLNTDVPIDVLIKNPEKGPLLTKIKLPGRSSFYEYYKHVVSQPDRGKRIIDERYGEGTWDKHLRQFDVFATMASEPLQYVFADYYLLDIFIVDKETRRHITRLWVTMLIDAYTRSVIGFSLLYEKPSIESIQSALHDTIWPSEIAASRQLTTKGVPIELSLDNGWPNHSHSLEELARRPELQIVLAYRPTYMARHGALIERFFGNLAHRLRKRLKHAGAILSSHPRDVQNAAKLACLLYDDVYQFILDEIVDYQNRRHRELNYLTPNQKWALEAREHGIITPPVPTPTLEREFLRHYRGVRPLGEKGISLFGMKYTSPEIRSLPRFSSTPREHPITGRKSQTVHYSIRFNIHDISRISVFDGTEWVGDAYASELRLPDGTHLPVSLAERKIAQDIARVRGSTNVSRDWVHYLKDRSATVKTRAEEKRRAHQLNTQSAIPPVDELPVIDAPINAKAPDSRDDWIGKTDEAMTSYWDI